MSQPDLNANDFLELTSGIEAYVRICYKNRKPFIFETGGGKWNVFRFPFLPRNGDVISIPSFGELRVIRIMWEFSDIEQETNDSDFGKLNIVIDTIKE